MVCCVIKKESIIILVEVEANNGVSTVCYLFVLASCMVAIMSECTVNAPVAFLNNNRSRSNLINSRVQVHGQLKNNMTLRSLMFLIVSILTPIAEVVFCLANDWDLSVCFTGLNELNQYYCLCIMCYQCARALSPRYRCEILLQQFYEHNNDICILQTSRNYFCVVSQDGDSWYQGDKVNCCHVLEIWYLFCDCLRFYERACVKWLTVI